MPVNAMVRRAPSSSSLSPSPAKKPPKSSKKDLVAEAAVAPQGVVAEAGAVVASVPVAAKRRAACAPKGVVAKAGAALAPVPGAAKRRAVKGKSSGTEPVESLAVAGAAAGSSGGAPMELLAVATGRHIGHKRPIDLRLWSS